jgi:hypothetical protein
MSTRTIRRTSVTLPSLDEPGPYLSNVTSLEGGRGRLSEFQYADADLRSLDLADTHLLDGRVTGLRTQRARLEEVPPAQSGLTGGDTQHHFNPISAPGVESTGLRAKATRPTCDDGKYPPSQEC